jgi:hypothetical protein
MGSERSHRSRRELHHGARCSVSLRALLLAALSLAAVSLAATGCRERNTRPAAKLPPCTAFGQTCEFSPGKLGSCVERDNCQGPTCFVCQSQH